MGQQGLKQGLKTGLSKLEGKGIIYLEDIMGKLNN